MVLHKKFFLTILFLTLIFCFFTNSVKAEDIEYVNNAVTIFDIEDYQRRRQDTYFNFIKKYNPTLFDTIKQQFNNGYFVYIAVTRNQNNLTSVKFRVYFYLLDNSTTYRTFTFGDTFIPYDIYDNQGSEVAQQIGSYYHGTAAIQPRLQNRI